MFTVRWYCLQLLLPFVLLLLLLVFGCLGFGSWCFDAGLVADGLCCFGLSFGLCVVGLQFVVFWLDCVGVC